jgi:hypothetical protein
MGSVPDAGDMSEGCRLARRSPYMLLLRGMCRHSALPPPPPPPGAAARVSACVVCVCVCVRARSFACVCRVSFKGVSTGEEGVEEGDGHVGFAVAAALAEEDHEALGVELGVVGVGAVRAHRPLPHAPEQRLRTRPGPLPPVSPARSMEAEGAITSSSPPTDQRI